MAHYAFIDTNNVVVDVITGRDETETIDGVSDWETYYGAQRNQTCLRTSVNTYGGIHYDPDTGEVSADQSNAFRYNYATPGSTYDATADAFIPESPHASWVLDTNSYTYVAPIDLPDDADTVAYTWDENSGDWVVVPGE